MPHDHCPPSLRGHTWKEVPLDAPSAGRQNDLRRCGRCGARGRVNKQGLIDVLIDAVERP